MYCTGFVRIGPHISPNSRSPLPPLKMALEKYKLFLDKYKSYVGLSDYDVKVIEDYDNAGSEYIAEANACRLEKELKVTLYGSFKELSSAKKKNVLFHELVHARVSICNSQIDDMSYEFEEDMVNDITRGFERIKKLKWVKET